MMVPILTKIMPQIIDYTFLFTGILAGCIGMTLEETLGKKIMDVIPEEIEEYRNNLKMELIESWTKGYFYFYIFIWLFKLNKFVLYLFL